jgi:hypothetical protein
MSHSIGRALLTGSAVICLCVSSHALTTPAARQVLASRAAVEGYGLSPTSPLVANRTSLFAVAANASTILRRDVSGFGAWNPLPGFEAAAPVMGLAATDEALYVAVPSKHAILKHHLLTNTTSMYAVLPDRFSPADLAFADTLYFSDATSTGIYRLSADGLPVPFLTGAGSRSPLFLAASDNVLIASSPDEGIIWQSQPSGFSSANAAWSPVQRPSLSNQGPDLRLVPDVVTPDRVSFALRPTSVSLYTGVVYVVDGNSKSIFAYSRSWPRPVRLQFGPQPVLRPTRIVATRDNLVILDADRGAIQLWPRFVPTRITCALRTPDAAQNSKAQTPPCAQTQHLLLAQFLADMDHNGVLPTRTLSLDRDLSAISSEGYGTVTMVRTMKAVACLLNPPLCETSGPARPARLPDVYGESYIDVQPLLLSGSETLGSTADQLVPSPQFVGFTSESKLAELNSAVHAKMGSFRSLSTGPVSCPIELVRFVVGIPVGQMESIRLQFRTLSLVPLSDSGAKRSSRTTVVQETLDVLKVAYKSMRNAIGGLFETAAPDIPVYVGVAEHNIDTGNPDLGDAFVIRQTMAPVRAAAAPAAAPLDYVIRPFSEEDDHGTAVAALIGARSTQFEGRGLAPDVFLVEIADGEPGIGDSIRQAFVTERARIFNLSFHFGKDNHPPALDDAIHQYPQALFVVAAGNDTVMGPDGNVCATFMAYPVCWGDLQNVLVVTATTLDGRSLLPPDTSVNPTIPGANWNPKLVHIAAPGDGYYAPGKGKSYVKVSGSSFATPLVTATAALLFSQGVRSPWEIKQRIIATADVVASLSDRVMSGRLNARRAATNVKFALTVDERDKETAIALDVAGADVVFRTPTGDLHVPLGNVRRLTRISVGKYRLTYLSLDGDKLERRDDILPSPWPFRYYELDAQGKRKAPGKNGDLSNYKDYIGPIVM